MLFMYNFIQAHRFSLFKWRKEFVFFRVAGHFIKTVKKKFFTACFESTFVPFEKDALGLKFRFCHLAGKETIIDQTVEFEFVSCEVFGSHFAIKVYIGWTDSLVCFLCPFRFGDIVFRFFWEVFIAKILFDIIS